MANEASQAFNYDLFDPEIMCFDSYIDELDFNGIITDENLYNNLLSPLPINSEGEESKSINELKSDNSFNHSEDNCLPSSTSSDEQNVKQSSSFYHEPITLSFINPPEYVYHVRYTSEITDSPVNGSLVNTRIKTKKNISGRYLKGLRGRHVSIMLPKMNFNSSDLYIRVTRLTVSCHDTTYIHPYPLLFSSKKEKSHSRVIAQDSSIYFKVSQDEIRSCSKQFPNIILTRSKQCDLNKMKYLYRFDKDCTPHPFSGEGAKNKIARYNLKKSLLDFRLVNLCDQTHQFIDTGISCRSGALVEAEGVKWQRLST